MRGRTCQLVRSIVVAMGIAGLLLTITLTAAAQSRSARLPRRAKPPEFNKSIVDVFFPDAREKLVGERPDPAALPKVAATPVPAAASTSAPPASAATASGEWSKVIDAEAVEGEIKDQQIRLVQSVQNATRFKGGEFRQARVSLSVLTAMMAIVAEFDERIRFKEYAASLRDQLGAAALNCNAGTDAAFQAAKGRSDDLQLLVRGGSLSLPEAKQVDWEKLADRPSLMQRLDAAQNGVITPAIASEGQFKKASEQLRHEAQIVAALAKIMTHEGFEYADDETYVEYAQAMQTLAEQIRSAALSERYEEARQAAGELGQSCKNCHDGYR